MKTKDTTAQQYYGLITSDGGETFVLYKIEALTYKSARLRLKQICERLEDTTEYEHNVEALLKDLTEVAPYSGKIVETKETSCFV